MTSAFDDLDLEVLRRRHSYKWRAHPKDVIPAFVAEMDFPLAGCVKEALHRAIDLDDCGYAFSEGLPEAFCEFVLRRHGWHVDPARVLMVADVLAGVDVTLSLCTSPGDGVVVNTPVYPLYFTHIRQLGRRVVEAPLRQAAQGWQLDLGLLERAFRNGAATAFLMCNPHDPTGIVLQRAELQAVAALAQRYGVTVLSDESHGALALPGAEHVPYVSLGEEVVGHSITFSSASKAFNLEGIKCAVMVAGSEALRRRLAAMAPRDGFGASLFGVLASIAAWEGGDDWLTGLLAQLDRNRSLLSQLLSEHLPGVHYVKPQASYLAWLDCRALGLGDDPSAAFLERGRVALSRGADFGRQGAGFARLNMGTSPAILETIVRSMARAV